MALGWSVYGLAQRGSRRFQPAARILGMHRNTLQKKPVEYQQRCPKVLDRANSLRL